jgi:hypothetical protein
MTAVRFATVLTVSALTGIAFARGATVSFDRGRLVSPDEGSRTRGHYKLVEITRDSASVERVQAWARHLDMSAVSEESPANFHVWLTTSDGVTSTDMGQMRVNRRGNAVFLLDSRESALPEGFTSVTAYAGGTIEIRDAGGASVLSATIGTFGQ